MGDVVVNIRGRLDPSVARAMRGVSDEARKSERARRAEEKKTADDARAKARETAKAKIKAEREAAAATKQTSREKARAEAEAARASAKSASDSLRAVKRAEEEKRREAEKTTREIAKQAQARAREEQRAARDVQRINQRVFAQRLRAGVQRQNEARERSAGMAQTFVGGATGMAVGALGAAVAYNAQRQSQLQGWLGAEDSDAVLAMAGGLQMTLTRLATQGDRAKSTLDGFVSVMAGFGAPVQESVEMMEEAQNLFVDQVDNIIAHASNVGRASMGMGATATDVMKIGALGVRDMGVSQAEYDDAIAIAMASTGKGAVSPMALGQNFQGSIGAAASTFATRGTEGFRQWAVGAQLAPNSGRATAPEQAHVYEEFLRRLNDPEIRAALEAKGADITTGENGTGQMRDMMTTMRALMTTDSLGAPGVLQDIFKDVQAAQYVEGIRRAGTGRLTELYESSSAASGEALIGAGYDQLMGTNVGRNAVEQSRRQDMIFQQTESAYGIARDETNFAQDYRARHATDNPWAVGAKVNAVTLMDRVAGWQNSADNWLTEAFGGTVSSERLASQQAGRQGIRGLLSDGPGQGGTSKVTLAGTPTVELGPSSLARLAQPAPSTAGEGSSGARGASPADRAR